MASKKVKIRVVAVEIAMRYVLFVCTVSRPANGGDEELRAFELKMRLCLHFHTSRTSVICESGALVVKWRMNLAMPRLELRFGIYRMLGEFASPFKGIQIVFHAIGMT